MAMMAALLAAVLASVFDRRRESAKTRDTIQLLGTQIAGLTATSTAHGQQLAGLGDQMAGLSTQVAGLTATSTAHSQQLADLKQDHRTTQEQLGQINSSLGNVRERLSRIEGHLRMHGPDTGELEAAG